MSSTAQLILAGLGVGFMVGLTGVGGGSLMTPILVFVFGHSPGTAVGTDLFFASATKAAGTAVHHQHRSVDWQIVRRLASGSLPASALMLVFLWATQATASKNGLVMTLLGALIMLTGAQTLGLIRLRVRATSGQPDIGVRLPLLTVAFGALLGALVTLTSIGAGALGIVMLRYLFPTRLGAATLVGTDLAHAIPLTLLAGVGYLAMGQVEFGVLGWLLLGSVPGVIVGSLLPSRLQEATVRKALGALLIVVGVKTLAAALAF